MIEIKNVREDEVMGIKENHVLKCFTDYLYHKHASDRIQEELDYIAGELATGSTSNGIIKVSKDAKGCSAPWENELLAREYELIKNQDEHLKEMEIVDRWIADIKNEGHKNIVIDYLINNRCENAEAVADHYFTTSGNVCKVTKRIITNIARRIY